MSFSAYIDNNVPCEQEEDDTLPKIRLSDEEWGNPVIQYLLETNRLPKSQVEKMSQENLSLEMEDISNIISSYITIRTLFLY